MAIKKFKILIKKKMCALLFLTRGTLTTVLLSLVSVVGKFQSSKHSLKYLFNANLSNTQVAVHSTFSKFDKHFKNKQLS